MIRSLLLASALILATGAAASAAPPIFSWTGFYVGVNAGLSAGDSFQTPGLTNNEDYYTYHATSRGLSGGGQLGFNYQFIGSNVVAGLEADFQGSALSGKYYSYVYVPPYDTGNFDQGENLQWWGTVRGRLGYAVGNFLPYVTGGFAYGHTTDHYAESYTNYNYNFAFGSTHVGWTAGAGVEYALTHNVSLKFEYLFTDLGSRTSENVYEGYESYPGYYTKTRLSFSTVRAGLDWKFDGYPPFTPVGSAPEMEGLADYAPPPMFSWSGFYVGVNVGLSGGNAFDTPGEYGYGDYYTYRATNRGVSGGVQAGYNFQFPGSRIVAGVETDFQGSTLDGRYYSFSYAPTYYNETENFGQHVQSWGTVRGRLGYALGNFLPYVTGGFAYGHTTDYYTEAYTNYNYNFAFGSMHTGWAAGAGLEYALTHNLTLKAEYLYTDLGSHTSPNVYDGYESYPGYYTRMRTDFSTVRAGLNWRLDWFAPPGPH